MNLILVFLLIKLNPEYQTTLAANRQETESNSKPASMYFEL